jgi:hypothetical protein
MMTLLAAAAGERPFPWAPVAATALFLVLSIWAVKSRRKG